MADSQNEMRAQAHAQAQALAEAFREQIEEIPPGMIYAVENEALVALDWEASATGTIDGVVNVRRGLVVDWAHGRYETLRLWGDGVDSEVTFPLWENMTEHEIARVVASLIRSHLVHRSVS